MVAKIRILPPEMAGKIAAGEVIERPASVVKELMENSLDAGSSVIMVDVEEGGKRQISVFDDGEGMTKADALLAFERHATSKVYEEGDLSAIQTLGFRGEALPSIAVVSRLRLITRIPDELSGTRVLVEGGKLVGVEEIGTPPGTRVTVEDLFYNVPARQKFLRGVQSEMAHIIEVTARTALINSSVGFILKHNKRVLFNLPPTHEERSRMNTILGKEVSSQLIEVQGSDGGAEVRGWATLPTYCRGSSKGIYIYVNRRYVRDKLISHAVSEAYRRFIPAKMYPVVVLFLSIPFSEVDVNVHPAKLEVRFRRGEGIHRLVADALKDVLSNPPAASYYSIPQIREEVASFSVSSSMINPGVEMVTSPLKWIVGQIKGTYLVVEDDEGVIIFDQHALHERILYERMKQSVQGDRLVQQPFLLPQPIEVKKEEKELLIGYRSELAKVGIELEDFGERTVAVQSIPSFLLGEDLQRFMESLSEELVEREKSDSVDHVLDRICVFLACRGAIKAHRRLHEEAAQSLLKDWEEIAKPSTCPHGRPLFVRWSWRELEGWFRRG